MEVKREERRVRWGGRIRGCGFSSWSFSVCGFKVGVAVVKCENLIFKS